MDNATRSERSRSAAIQAALAIIARDGPGRLTLDAIARESGISKGGVMHHFRTKAAVLKALLEHQIEHFEAFSRDYLAKADPGKPGVNLAAQIMTLRESAAQPHSAFFAILAAVAEDPGLLAATREIDAGKFEAIKAEAADPDLATLRWMAARGLALSTMLGLSSLSEAEHDRLFDRLLDDRQWAAAPAAEAPVPIHTPRSRARSPR
jgi:AcrR family transcriptional regulator